MPTTKPTVTSSVSTGGSAVPQRKEVTETQDEQLHALPSDRELGELFCGPKSRPLTVMVPVNDLA